MAGDDFHEPRFLVMIDVPKEPGKYAHVTTDGLELRHAGYWLSLADHQLIANPSKTRNVTVDIPVANLLTVQSLLFLFESRPGEVSVPAVQFQTRGAS